MISTSAIELPNDFHPDSRIWIFQSERYLSAQDIQDIDELLQPFIARWKSHGDRVKGYATILYNRFILLMADESETMVSGCSTDGAIHIIKEIENKFQLQLFNRLNLAFLVNDSLIQLPLTAVPQALKDGNLQPLTPYFNNTVLTKQEFENNWLISLENSWLKTKLQLQ
ncbi:MAG: hypothetical protein NTZ41_09940 [Sphingobacteriales bacterium]|nr:hypothetical protein [Sphingobacteriales bacterium]